MVRNFVLNSVKSALKDKSTSTRDSRGVEVVGGRYVVAVPLRSPEGKRAALDLITKWEAQRRSGTGTEVGVRKRTIRIPSQTEMDTRIEELERRAERIALNTLQLDYTQVPTTEALLTAMDRQLTKWHKIVLVSGFENGDVLRKYASDCLIALNNPDCPLREVPIQHRVSFFERTYTLTREVDIYGGRTQ